jgi:glycosyltransferase involved in cell wall biosynthesis
MLNGPASVGNPPGRAPLASVVIPCRGHAKEVARCLRSLERQRVEFPFETIVVDSASDPAVEEVVREAAAVRQPATHKPAATRQCAAVRLVRSEKPLRPGPARTLGVSHARGTFLVFIDADCQAEPGWLAAAVAGLRDRLGDGPTDGPRAGRRAGQKAEHGERVHMVGGPVLDARPWHPVAVTDNLLQFSDFRPGRRDGPARYFPGCNMAVLRSSFARAGGFQDPEFGAGEDTGLCNRFLERWPDGLRFVQGMRVKHDGRAGFREMLRHQAGFGSARGRLRLHLTPRQQRLGSFALLLPAVAMKRLVYLLNRNVRWDPLRAPRLVLLLPLIVPGLLAWAVGFRRGCREAIREEVPEAPMPGPSNTPGRR